MFSIGERVQISDPGWIWDGKIGDVLAADPADGEHEAQYIVRVQWPNGAPRRYTFWHSQVRVAPADIK